LSNQFFKNYRSLERHFDSQHFLCHDVQCLSARFVVFENELDLRHHERQVHGGTSAGNAKIQLEFRIRRSNEEHHNQEVPSDNDFNYGLDGQAFVPAELPQSEGVHLHPIHVQRTAELRERAAALRDNQSNDAEAFPTLAGESIEQSDTAQQAFRVGWNSNSTLQKVGRKKNAGQVTEEDFPSLPAAPKPKAKSSSINKLMPALGGSSNQRKQFAAMQISANAGGSRWKNSAASAASGAASTPTPSFLASTSATSILRNSEANLTSENFPSLGGPSTAQQHRYTAADALVKKKQSGSNLTSDNFPSLGGASSSQGHRYAAADALAKKQQPREAQVPSWDDATDFPTPASSNTKSSSVREKLLGSSSRGPSNAAMANVLQAPSVQHNVTVEDMKASLGPAKYKQLKKLTKEFASGELAPDAYVDHSAALFDHGYGDQDFWIFLPTLLASCPNEHEANQASNYMDNLRRLRSGAITAESVSQSKGEQASDHLWSSTGPSISAESPSRPTVTQGQWSSASARVAAAPSSAMTSSQPAGRYVAPPPPVRTVPGKKKAAWGGAGGASTIVRAKAPPGSVAVAAADAKPKTGTATKYMAQQSKQEKQQQQNSQASGKAKKKKSQKNELRQLAFG